LDSEIYLEFLRLKRQSFNRWSAFQINENLANNAETIILSLGLPNQVLPQFVSKFSLSVWPGHEGLCLDSISLGKFCKQGLSESASMELSSAAEEHWSDGALDVRLSSTAKSILV